MKPKNFPERRRQRQLMALENLRNQSTNRTREKQIKVLEKRTLFSLRDMRTKKQRAI